jgi:hypothetical protein
LRLPFVFPCFGLVFMLVSVCPGRTDMLKPRATNCGIGVPASLSGAEDAQTMSNEILDPGQSCNTSKSLNVRNGQVYRSQVYETTIRYELDSDRNPTVERWSFCATEDDAVYGNACLLISIFEVIETDLCGTLVAHYRQWFDEDGEPISARRRFIHRLASVKRFLRTHKSLLLNP